MDKSLVGVRFRESGKIYYFDPGDIELRKGDAVIVSTSNGEDYGRVMLDPRDIPEENIKDEIYPVVRKATQEDKERKKYLEGLGEDAKKVFMDRVSDRNLGMKLIDVQYTFDEKKVIFYFTAEGRVDFRELVKDLAGYFHARIELRQIGVRDEARKFASIGVCGRKCCCASWLNDFVPVSIKMAKEQNLSLNSTKISGICGRLLCCLTYEEEYYEELSKRMPKIGAQIKTPDGLGTVYKLRTLDEAVLVKIVNDQNETEIRRYTLEELDEAEKMPAVKVARKLPSTSNISPASKAYREVVQEQRQNAQPITARPEKPKRKSATRKPNRSKNWQKSRSAKTEQKKKSAAPVKKSNKRKPTQRTPGKQTTFRSRERDMSQQKKRQPAKKKRTPSAAFKTQQKRRIKPRVKIKTK